jgi:energy-coupling factor transporter ATP-binding protein EcfA2
MIVQIRGASGSGKSTIVAPFARVLPTYAEGALFAAPESEAAGVRPTAKIGHASSDGGLFIVGPYSNTSPTGGCDRLRGYEGAFRVVRAAAAAWRLVVFEGLVVSDEYRRTVEIAKSHPLVVLQLDLPFETMLESLEKRRAERTAAGKPPRLATTNVPRLQKRYDYIRKVSGRLERAGVDVRWVSREGAAASLAVEIMRASPDVRALAQERSA